jgi:kynurenine formamidase
MTRLVDLSHPLSPATPVLPGDQPLVVTPRTTHQTHGYAAQSLLLGTHAGTHLDAPFHMLPGGPTLESIPVSHFAGPTVVLDVRRPAETALDRAALTAADRARRSGDRPLDGCRLCLLWTGWDAHFGDEVMVRHPYLTLDGAAWLLESGVQLVGTDAPSLDPVLAENFPVHERLMGQGVVLVENLTGLGALGSRPLLCAFLPLPLVGADGSPVRAVAWVEAGGPDPRP